MAPPAMRRLHRRDCSGAPRCRGGGRRAAAAAVCGALLSAPRGADGMFASVPLDGKMWNTYLAAFVFKTSSPDRVDGGKAYLKHMESPNDFGFEYWASADAPETLRIAFYDDEDWSWPHVHPIIQDPPGDIGAACDNITTPGHNGGPSHGTLPLGKVCTEQSRCYRPIVQHARRRYWYALAVDCDGGEYHGVEVSVRATNPGGWWRHEFAVDKTGLLELYVLSVPVQLALTVWYHWREQALQCAPSHITAAFSASVFTQLIASLFGLLHYVLYAGDGVGAPHALAVGEVLSTSASLILMGLLIVCASAFTLVPQDGEAGVRIWIRRQRQVLLFSFCALLGCNAGVLIWRHWFLHGHKTHTYAFPYDAAPGVILAALRIPILLYFIMTLQSTLRGLPEYRRFYACTGAIFATYIASLPILVFTAELLSPWVRYRYVEIPHVVTLLIAQVGMGYLLWPGRRRQLILSRSCPVHDDDGLYQREHDPPLSAASEEGMGVRCCDAPCSVVMDEFVV